MTLWKREPVAITLGVVLVLGFGIVVAAVALGVDAGSAASVVATLGTVFGAILARSQVTPVADPNLPDH